MTTRTRLLVDGDATAVEVIAAALRSAGLSTVDVDPVPYRPDVSAFPVPPGSWAVLADVSPELAYADWRHEMLSHGPTPEPYPLQASGRAGSDVFALRTAV